MDYQANIWILTIVDSGSELMVAVRTWKNEYSPLDLGQKNSMVEIELLQKHASHMASL